MSTDRLFEMRFPEVVLPPTGEAFPPPHAPLSVGDTAVDIDGRVVIVDKIHIDGGVTVKGTEFDYGIYRISPQYLKLVSKAPSPQPVGTSAKQWVAEQHLRILQKKYDQVNALYRMSQSRNKLLEIMVDEIEEEIHDQYAAKYVLEYRSEMVDLLKHGDLTIREQAWLTKHIETVGDD